MSELLSPAVAALVRLLAQAAVREMQKQGSAAPAGIAPANRQQTAINMHQATE